MIGDFCVSLILLSDKTLCPASPSLQWVAWVSLPHLLGLLTARPSVLRSAKTTASPSRVTSLDARSPVPRQSPFVRFSPSGWRPPASAWPSYYTGRLSGCFSHEEFAVLSSSQAIPLCTCPDLSLRWCPLVCHTTARTHTFQQIQTVGFPRHHNGLSMLSI